MTESYDTEPKAVYSFVVPVYNEEESLSELHRRLGSLMNSLDGAAEAILIDDGSRDNSYALMLELHAIDARFKVVHFSRNFGKEVAVSAGLDLATGDAVVLLDADLQDPPELVLEMAKQWRSGYDMVYAKRDRRLDETWFKRNSARLFYRVLRRISDVDVPVDVGDFRLVDRRALDAFRAMRERNRYLRGMFGWIGFRQTSVSYVRQGRFAGTTKYSITKMVKLAFDGIVSFSTAPLRMVLQIGFIVSIFSFVAGIAAIVIKLSGMYAISGWASITVLMSFIGGVQLTVLGVVGEYVGRIYDEVKQRPLYLVRELRGFGALDRAPNQLFTQLAQRRSEESEASRKAQ